jgi:uncharacterized membrane protein YdjX (TVP38/TMEM64 family)
LKKWLIVIPYLLIILISYHYKDALIQWIKSEDPSLLPYMVVLSVFIAVFPVVPFSLFAGVMGVKYGPIVGGLINWLGSVTAAALFFILTRNAYAVFLRNYISRFKGLNKFNQLIEQNSFLAVFFARVIHIVPTPVINIYSGISTMTLSTFLMATVLGQMPGMFLYAYIGDQIFAAPKNILIGVSFYLAFVLTTFLIYRYWYRGKQKFVNN